MTKQATAISTPATDCHQDAAEAPERREHRQPSFLIDVLSKRQRWQFQLLCLAWIAGVLVFYAWWFRSNHVVSLTDFIVNTILVTWTVLLPAYFLGFVARMKRVNPSLQIPHDWRVAMITTRAPSEPFDIVRTTLEAMLAQSHAHETWLADEAPTDEIREWCRDRGVFVSTRLGVADYHRDCWPRRTKCKEGNLAFFYDNYGYERYDIVVQLDADHVPETGYLENMLRPFVDPSVGYVSAPSICDSNASSSWAARGRLYSESLMHGPLQAGYSNGYAPLCIGSHYAIRTTALRDIGGLGPELAEDHTTTLIMNGHGWRGVHALDAIARGEGPPTLTACVTQEFQWSRSLMIVLLTVLPRYWKVLPWRMRLQFLFSELWYPLFSMSMFCGLLLPVIAILTKQPWVRMSFLDFLGHATPPALITLAIHTCFRRWGLNRPSYSPAISWEAALFQVVRWPWAAYGTAMGLLVAIRQKHVEFRVTPKGSQHAVSLPWKLLLPYLVLLVLTFLPTVLVRSAGAAEGYYFFLILSQLTYLIALFSIVLIHRHEVKKQR